MASVNPFIGVSSSISDLTNRLSNRDSYSNASMPVDDPLSGIDTNAHGSTYRGPLSSWFNQENIEKEDFSRAEQSANNSFLRDLYMHQYNNQFNASEAQKSRDFQVDFAKNSYKYAVESMKAAGLNPLLAYQNGSAEAPSSVSARSASSYYGGRSNYRSSTHDKAAEVVVSLLKVAAGMYMNNANLLSDSVGLVGTLEHYFPYGEDGYTRYVDYNYGKKKFYPTEYKK